MLLSFTFPEQPTFDLTEPLKIEAGGLIRLLHWIPPQERKPPPLMPPRRPPLRPGCPTDARQVRVSHNSIHSSIVIVCLTVFAALVPRRRGAICRTRGLFAAHRSHKRQRVADSSDEFRHLSVFASMCQLLAHREGRKRPE